MGKEIEIILLDQVISIINNKIYNSDYHKYHVEKAVKQLAIKTIKSGKLLLKDAIETGYKYYKLAEKENKNIYIFNTPTKDSCILLADTALQALDMIKKVIEEAYKAPPTQYLTGIEEKIREVAIPVGEWINENLPNGLKTAWHKCKEKGSIGVKIMKNIERGNNFFKLTVPDIIIVFHKTKVQLYLLNGIGISDSMNIEYSNPEMFNIIKNKILDTYK